MIKVDTLADGIFRVEITGEHLEIIEGVTGKRLWCADVIIWKMLYACLRVDDSNIFMKGNQDGLEGKNG